MGAGGDFGDDATVAFVLGLGVDDVGEGAAAAGVEDGGAGIIAGGFDSEDHGLIIVAGYRLFPSGDSAFLQAWFVRWLIKRRAGFGALFVGCY